jgi:MFS family permease
MNRLFRDNARFARDNVRWIGAGFLLTFFSSFGQTFFVGLSGNDLRARFDLSGGEFGMIYMAATLASAGLLPWLGRTLDLMPAWKVARFTMLSLAIACVAIAIAPTVAVLLVAIFLLRLFGQGMMTEIAYTETGRWFAANRGRAMALIIQGQQAGVALFPALFVIASTTFGWRGAWLSSAAVVLLIGAPAILTLLRIERTPKSAQPASDGPAAPRDWTRSEVLRDPLFYLLLLGILAPPFIGTTIFFHQGYLIELRGYDPLVFAGAFPVMAASTVLFSLVAGHIIDEISALRMVDFALLPLALACVVGAAVEPVWGIYAFMFLLGVSNGFTGTLMGAIWPEVYGLANLGGIRAITVSALVTATAVGPGITGWLIDTGVALPTQMMWMAGWCLFASVALAGASRSIIRRQREEGQHP